MLAILAAIVAALVAHEAGHVLAARRYGFRLRSAASGNGGIGVLVVRTPESPLRRRERFWIALAGPLGSFELATVAHVHGLTLMAFWSAALGLLSLVPVKHSDGRKALDAILDKGE